MDHANSLSARSTRTAPAAPPLAEAEAGCAASCCTPPCATTTKRADGVRCASWCAIAITRRWRIAAMCEQEGHGADMRTRVVDRGPKTRHEPMGAESALEAAAKHIA
eukprot:4960138-Prymnesium_polylepis.3